MCALVCYLCKKQSPMIIKTYKILLFALLGIVIACRSDKQIGAMHATKKDKSVKTNTSILTIEPKIIDFGNIKNSSRKIYTRYITLRNEGDKPISIGKADVSCSCMTFTFANIIFPHKTAKARIDIDPTNKLGAFNKAIFINSTASNNLEIIRVKASIQGE